MASRSTLELMLEKIQELENEAEDHGSPPPLPARPVSRARRPSHARRALQQSPMMEAVVNCAQELIQTNELDDMNTKQSKIQGVLILQRCYRGYRTRCYVNELKGSVIKLQSFIRAEMSRKAYHHLAERLSPDTQMQRRNVLDVQSNLLQGKIAAIIILQSGIRSWLTRKRYKNVETSNAVPVEKSPDQSTIKQDLKDHIQIPYSIVSELQIQVLKTEAALQERKEQNADLMNNLKKYEKRWLEYEDKMKSMEKMWQEQLTSMQVSLADAAKKRAAARRTVTKSPELLQVESPLNMIDNSASHRINLDNADLYNIDDENYFRVKLGSRVSKKDVIVEFQKLETQFGAWEKEYSVILEETKATMKKLLLPPKEKNQKKWWRRPLRN